MPFGGTHPSEAVLQAESTSKHINDVLHFRRASVKSTVLVGRRELVCRNPAKPFLGARGLCLPLGSGKDSQQKLSYCLLKTGTFSRLITAQSKIFFCPGRRPGSPYDATRGAENGQFLVCLPPVDGAMCTEGCFGMISAASSHFIAQRRRTRRTRVR